METTIFRSKCSPRWRPFICFACLSLLALQAQAQIAPHVAILADASGQGGRVGASILIDAPPAIVWEVMVDCRNAPRFVPRLQSCEVESRAANGTTDIRKHRIAWLDGFPVVAIRFVSTYRDLEEIRFQRLSGDIAHMTGSWRLQTVNEGRATQLSYEAHLVPSRFLPAALVRSALLRDTPKILLAVRNEALTRASRMP